jgi:pyruvate ferredoxin oxidoreductase alpha subunit
VRSYPGEASETVVVALGSVLGTIDEVVDELRAEGVDIGALGIRCFRPYPLDEIRQALARARRVIVIEKAFAVGIGGIVGQNVRLALSGLPVSVYDVVAGLGGRPITKRSLRTLIADVLSERLEPDCLTFLDLDRGLVESELRRIAASPRSGPHAENILRDVGAVAAGPH